MSESKNYFCLLPPKVTQGIFDSVQSQETPLFVPLSKYLLPFQQKPLFRSLCLRSFEEVQVLCDTSNTRSSPFNLIERLRIVIDRPVIEGTLRESFDPSTPSSSDLRKLFQKLTNVGILGVYGSSRLAGLILNSETASSSFPNLRSLTISSELLQFEDPFHPAHYSTLQYYSELQHFNLYVPRSYKRVHPSPKPLPELSSLETRIYRVQLSDPLSASKASVIGLLALFGVLYELSIIDSHPTSRILHLLDGLDYPEDLHSLSIDHLGGNNSIIKGSVIKSLSPFSNLAHLTLGQRFSSLSPTFYNALRNLPLHSIGFQLDAKVSLAQLTKLITGPKKHSTLHALIFDNVMGEIGPTIEEAGMPYQGPSGEEWDVYPDWILPDWTAAFSRKGLIRFLEVAEKEGIHVEGTALEALDIEIEFEGEFDFINGAGADWED
ncbi:hypothetical protein JCM5353_003254 [Sporobolomyces roseus]